MKLIARHEKDDRDIELEPEQVDEFESETGLSVAALRSAGVARLEMNDGWHYRLAD